MFDELFEMFDRGDQEDGRRTRDGATPRRGIRGFLSRLFSGDDQDHYEDDQAERRGRTAAGAAVDEGSNRRDRKGDRGRNEGFDGFDD